MLGTLVNALTVMLGSSAGLLLKRKVIRGGSKAIFHVVGLFTLYLGAQMALETTDPVSLILGLLTGTLLGEYLDLENLMENGAERVKRRVGGGSEFVEGMITAFLTFCVGPLTIVGSLRDGMGDPSILMTKAVMDGFTSMAYASALGIGVLFSVIPLTVFQGSLAFIGSLAGASLPNVLISNLAGAGGIILLGLALDILELKKIKVGNMLPSLITVPLIYLILHTM